jgi:catechol 2,3-dioxygenase-like lactoylglutathione lyase family enzyme
MSTPDYKDSYLPNALFRETAQICLVTRDLDALVRRYADRLGIGPWWVQVYEPPLLTATTYRGKPAAYSMRIALAWTGGLNWEIIQPLQGPSIYHDFLDAHGEGVQHVGVLLKDTGMDWPEAYRRLAERGFEPVQEGGWQGVRFAYFETEPLCKTTLELIDRPPGWSRPEPLYWYPPKR